MSKMTILIFVGGVILALLALLFILSLFHRLIKFIFKVKFINEDNIPAREFQTGPLKIIRADGLMESEIIYDEKKGTYHRKGGEGSTNFPFIKVECYEKFMTFQVFKVKRAIRYNKILAANEGLMEGEILIKFGENKNITLILFSKEDFFFLKNRIRKSR